MTTLINHVKDLEFLSVNKFDDALNRDIAMRNAREFIKLSHSPTVMGKLLNLVRNTSKRSRYYAYILDYEMKNIKPIVEKIDSYLLELRGQITQYWMRIHDIDEQSKQFAIQDQMAIKISKSLTLERAQLEKAVQRVEEVCLEFETKKEKLRTVKNEMIRLLIQLEKIGNFELYSQNWLESDETAGSA